ncbi:MAG: hypothetical protein P8164_14715 [Gammaproteobacteria bacterium]|jgi:predicted pyridoxine 5'-phosphate oxidase superfamily flavin-nucleotide-binding protein
MKYFKEIIKTREEFRSIAKDPSELVTGKTLSYLDKHRAVFINRSPFMLLAMADADGNAGRILSGFMTNHGAAAAR